MKIRSSSASVLFVSALVFLLLSSSVNRLEACSVLKVTSQDGTIISARTMEFGNDVQSAVVVIPRGKEFVSPAPQNRTGISWINQYGYVGINAFGEEMTVLDGLNETGLACSGLWYEKDTQYQDIDADESDQALAHLLLCSWILGNFATVGEVEEAITNIKVFGIVIPQMGIAPPIHIAVYDEEGGAIVIEFDQGQLHIYDNPLGIMTNSPNFHWMMTNLRQYVGMNVSMVQTQYYAGVQLLPTGHGSGMFGLPGDLTPPSRFVRMAVLTHFADSVPDARGALNLAQHIINTLDITRGMVVDKDSSGNIVSSETTQWVTFRDLTNKIFYFRTYDNFTLRKIDLNQLDFSTCQTISLTEDDEVIIDVTNRLNQ
ncbi:MAG: choloylglycine hydrolase family protein [Candidatus Aegiribacteria sp.]|nr:choloylglycine hydrolase family protein [Candidatus Aegiribacteria sp.]